MRTPLRILRMAAIEGRQQTCQLLHISRRPVKLHRKFGNGRLYGSRPGLLRRQLLSKLCEDAVIKLGLGAQCQLCIDIALASSIAILRNMDMNESGWLMQATEAGKCSSPCGRPSGVPCFLCVFCLQLGTPFSFPLGSATRLAAWLHQKRLKRQQFLHSWIAMQKHFSNDFSQRLRPTHIHPALIAL